MVGLNTTHYSSMNKTNHITPAGFAKLKAEWEHLKFTERPTTKQSVADAAAQGDRSENADYIYGKMKLRDIDKRLRYLDKILDNCIIVEEVADHDQIRFGAKVLVKNERGKDQEFQIVGNAEVDPLEGRISPQSPIGKALMHKKAGEEVLINTPAGKKKFLIQEISYE